MRRKGVYGIGIWAVFLVVGLAALLPLSVLAMPSEDGCCGTGDEAQEHGPGMMYDEDREYGEGMEHAEREDCMMRAEEAWMFGKFTMDGTNVSGRFVRFEFSDGIVSDFEVYNGTDYVRIFDSIEIENFTPDDVHVEGAVFWANGTDTRIVIHNNPSAIVQIIAPYSTEGFVVRYAIAEGVDVEEGNDSARAYMLEAGDLDAYLITPHESAMENSTITVRFSADNTTGHSLFMVVPDYPQKMKESRMEIMEGIMKGKIGGEIDIASAGRDHESHKVIYRDDLSMEVQKMERNSIRIRVESRNHSGTCVLIRLDRNTADIDPSEAVVKLDGMEIKRADLSQVIAGGDEPMYAIERSGTDITELAVYIPSFSAHEITIEKAGTQDYGSIPLTYLALIVMGIIGIVVIALVIRRK